MDVRPRVTKNERKLFLSYRLPHRIHCASICPCPAPNTSTVIFYGHASGLRVLWRGGKYRKQRTRRKDTPNGTSSSSEVITIEDYNDQLESTKPYLAHVDADEGDEEELDPDCPYPSFIQDIDVHADSDILRVAVLSPRGSTTSQHFLERTAVVAVSSADGAVRILQIPLAPPSFQERHAFVEAVGHSQIELCPAGPVPSDLSLKLVCGAMNSAPDEVLVAHAADALFIHRFTFEEAGLSAKASLHWKVGLPSTPKRISIDQSPRTSHILVTDISGAARIYEPFAHAPKRTESQGSINDEVFSGSGKWLMSYLAPFRATKDQTNPFSTRRKRILDAQWVSGGRRIFALLEDGEWGLWGDATGTSQTGRSHGDFILRGYLSMSPVADGPDPTAKSRKGYFNLAPTTPNTRRAKQETLFTGAPKPTGAAARGGISVSPNSSRPGSIPDESVILWYNSDVYSIPSIQSFIQRSTPNDGAGFGSLYAPSLFHITDIQLSSENITSIAQFEGSSSGLGQMNVQRDLLVSAEYQALILQSTRVSTPSRGLFQQAIAERPSSRDQEMLDAGDLDLGGVDRMLDSMAGQSRPLGRRVGFAE